MAPHHKLVVLAAVTLIAVSGCGTRSGEAAPPKGTALASSAPGPASGSRLSHPVVVRLPLSAAARNALLAWLEDWRACMSDHHVQLPEPQVFPRHITVDVSAVDGVLTPGAAKRPAPSAFMRTSLRCVAAVGGPPATFLRTGGIIDVFKGTCAVTQSARRAGQ